MGPPMSNHPHMGPRTTGSLHMGPRASGSPHMGHPSSGSHMGHHGGMSPHMRPPPSGSPLNRPPIPGSPHTPVPGSPIGVPGSPLGSPHTRSPLPAQSMGDSHMHQSRGPSPGGFNSSSPAGHTNVGASNGPVFQIGGSPSHPLPGPAASPGFCLISPLYRYATNHTPECTVAVLVLISLTPCSPLGSQSHLYYSIAHVSILLIGHVYCELLVTSCV